MPGLVKVGRTDRSVVERVAELDGATGVPERFKVEAVFLSENTPADEKRAHFVLTDVRTRQQREFFRVQADVAIARLTTAYGKAPEFCRAEQRKRIREARRRERIRQEREDAKELARQQRLQRREQAMLKKWRRRLDGDFASAAAALDRLDCKLRERQQRDREFGIPLRCAALGGMLLACVFGLLTDGHLMPLLGIFATSLALLISALNDASVVPDGSIQELAQEPLGCPHCHARSWITFQPPTGERPGVFSFELTRARLEELTRTLRCFWCETTPWESAALAHARSQRKRQALGVYKTPLSP